MSNAVKSLEALINTYEKNDQLSGELSRIMEGPADFLPKVKSFDEVFDKHTGYEPVREYAFDLVMAHHLEINNEDEDYFDSREWQEIEDQTLERGTELLNILLYISEARETEAEVSVEDFLYEFLLVDEDEFQDEHRIYEELIANQDLVEEDVRTISEVAKRLPDELEIRELFMPLLLFFKEPDAKSISKEAQGKLTPTECALLSCILAYASQEK